MSDNQIIGVINNSLQIVATIIDSGPKGEPGIKGDTPIKGVDYFTQNDIDEFLSNVVQDKTYTHNQISGSDVWSITHNLNKYPSVTILNSAGSVSIGEINYISLNEIQITFSASFSGKAYLN